MSKVLITFIPPAKVLERARQLFEIKLANPPIVTSEALLKEVREFQPDGLLVSSALPIREATINSLPPSVKVIATWSVGYDHFDIGPAKARGIQMTNTPEVLTDCTADLFMLLILGASRRLREYTQLMDKGWRTSVGQSGMLGHSLSGKTLGILGLGRIGRAVAERARAFKMKVIYHNPRRLPSELEGDAVYFPNFEAMLPHCNVLSLHAPANPATQSIMNEKTLALLPEEAVLVNVARGSLIDEEALIAALTSRKLFAAGLDVFENEPAFDLRFLELPNVLLTPHMGSASIETRTAMGNRALDNLVAALKGETPLDLLAK